MYGQSRQVFESEPIGDMIYHSNDHDIPCTGVQILQAQRSGENLPCIVVLVPGWHTNRILTATHSRKEAMHLLDIGEPCLIASSCGSSHALLDLQPPPLGNSIISKLIQ